jgi:hypothetical protein
MASEKYYGLYMTKVHDLVSGFGIQEPKWPGLGIGDTRRVKDQLDDYVKMQPNSMLFECQLSDFWIGVIAPYDEYFSTHSTLVDISRIDHEHKELLEQNGVILAGVCWLESKAYGENYFVNWIDTIVRRCNVSHKMLDLIENALQGVLLPGEVIKSAAGYWFKYLVNSGIQEWCDIARMFGKARPTVELYEMWRELKPIYDQRIAIPLGGGGYTLEEPPKMAVDWSLYDEADQPATPQSDDSSSDQDEYGKRYLCAAALHAAPERLRRSPQFYLDIFCHCDKNVLLSQMPPSLRKNEQLFKQLAEIYPFAVRYADKSIQPQVLATIDPSIKAHFEIVD